MNTELHTSPNLDAAQFAASAIESLHGQPDQRSLLGGILPNLVRLLALRSAGWVVQRGSRWEAVAWAGAGDSAASSVPATADLPVPLVSDAVDQLALRTDGHWCAVPNRSSAGVKGRLVATESASCLLIEFGADPIPPATIEWAASLVIAAANHADSDARNRHRIGQLTSVLEAAAQWQQTQLQNSEDDTALLRQIADKATELLDCQRSSIFLWDKRRKKLIGKPALGIEDDALEVPDNQGVVGEVLTTTEPKIWNLDSDDESRVNRDVDRSLQFETQSLVAVPLIGRRGETIGVFEAINHQENRFNESHALLLADLATHAAVAIQAHRAQKSLTESRDRLVADAASQTQLIGEHPDVVAVKQSGSKVAKTDLTVLILGSNGTGKEVLARHIHYESNRRNGPFVAVNCAALVESLLESELFGHEKGAFTDANATRAGKFELASGGTLFLDEVGDMSPGGQAKLLRVLEQKEVVRVGGSVPIAVDVRVIAATNQPLEELIAEKRFREDLFFRLNVVSLALPDLASRGRDVLSLAEHFLQHFCYEIGRRVPLFSDSAKTALLSHSWPGNVRELRNTIERVCYLHSGDEIAARDLELHGAGREAPVAQAPQATPSLDVPDSLADSTRLFQIEHIRNAIDRCGGNMTEAATRLELHRSNLYRKMKQLGMQGGDGGDEES